MFDYATMSRALPNARYACVAMSYATLRVETDYMPVMLHVACAMPRLLRTATYAPAGAMPDVYKI